MNNLQLYVKASAGVFHLIGVLPGKDVYLLGHHREFGKLLDKVRQYAGEFGIPDEQVFYRGEPLSMAENNGDERLQPILE